MSNSVSLSDTNISTNNTHHFHPSILRAYDIRGVYDKTLFPEDALAIGKAFATIIIKRSKKSAPKIALSYDGRLSTPDLKTALIEGITSTGANICDIGLGPTPMLYFAVHHLETDAGIMITGSHNPKNHNGFKMMIGQNSFFGEDIKYLAEIAHNADYETGSGSIETHNITDNYISALLSGFTADNSQPLQIAFDTGNGAAGLICSKLVEQLPGNHLLINAEVDGNFPNHHPDPTIPENMQQLIQTVQQGDYDFGIAFDGDGDRIGAVDSKGRILYGDQLMTIFSRDVLKHNPEAVIIADVKASQTLFDDITAHGGKAVMWKTGHSLIKTKMKELGAKLAGEMSGHIFFADNYFGFDDGLYAAVRLVNIVAHSEKSLSEIVDTIPTSFATPEIRIDVSDETKFALIDDIKHYLKDMGADFIDVDGVRVQTENGWWLARASNTQPAIIIRAEGKSQAALNNLLENLTTALKAVGITHAPLLKNHIS